MYFRHKYIKAYKHCTSDFMLRSHVFRCVRKNRKMQLLALPCPSVCLSALNSSPPSGWIFMKFDS